DDRTVAADRLSADAELLGELSHRPRPARRDEHDLDPGRGRIAHGRLRAPREGPVAAEERAVQVDRGQPDQRLAEEGAGDGVPPWRHRLELRRGLLE